MALKEFKNMLTLSVLYYKFLGIVPLKYSEKGFKISKDCVIFNVTNITIYILLCVYAMHKDILYEKSLLILTTNYLQYSFFTIQNVTIWAWALLKYKEHITLLLAIMEIDEKFQRLGVHMYYEEMRKKINFGIFARTILTLTSLVIQYITNLFFSPTTDIFLYLLYYLPQIIHGALCQAVIIYVNILKSRFDALNEHLEELQHFEDSVPEAVANINLTVPWRTKLSMLQHICDIHHELSRAIGIVNSVFGLSLLSLFTESFVAMVSSSYYSILMINFAVLQETMFFVCMVTIFVMMSINTWMLCYFCNSATEEAKKTATLIHRIDYKEDEVKDQIEMFSLQIAHENLEFSAAGFFPINNSALFSIIGGITTYLIILLQLSTEVNLFEN